jgi:hypothetical protein
MDGLMDEWMDGWDGWRDGWTNEWMGGMDEWMHGWMECVNEWMCGRKDGWTHVLAVGGWMHGWEGCMDMDAWVRRMMPGREEEGTTYEKHLMSINVLKSYLLS